MLMGLSSLTRTFSYPFYRDDCKRILWHLQWIYLFIYFSFHSFFFLTFSLLIRCIFWDIGIVIGRKKVCLKINFIFFLWWDHSLLCAYAGFYHIITRLNIKGNRIKKNFTQLFNCLDSYLIKLWARSIKALIWMHAKRVSASCWPTY